MSVKHQCPQSCKIEKGYQTRLRMYYCTNFYVLQWVKFNPWPFYFKINTGFLQSTVCLAKVSQDIEWLTDYYVRYTCSLTLDFYLIMYRGSWLYRTYQLGYQIWCLSSKEFVRYWAVSNFLYSVWPLTFHLKIKSCHLLIGYTSSSSLMSIQQRSLKILSGQYIHMTRFTLDLWLIDLKINRGHWFIRMYQCMKFKDCQAKSSQDIEWSVYSYVQFALWPQNQ
jgi:hypothetical protein